MPDNFRRRTPLRWLLPAAALAAAGLTAPAGAQVTLDVIGPHEYELPVGFEPFNVFVQYATFQRADKVWDDGERRGTPKSEVLVGLSKYVRFWSPASNRKIGIAYEVIVPEVGIRDRDDRTSSSGIGDPLTGPAIWFKPSANSTLGFQSFVQLPVGDADVGGGDVWKNLSSVFWDVQAGRWTYTADAGFVFFGESSAADATPATLFHTNHRVGFAVNDVVEPFVGLDYERQGSWKNRATGRKVAASHETVAGAGVMFNYYGNQSLTLRYSRGVDGDRHGATNSLNLKYAYAW